MSDAEVLREAHKAVRLYVKERSVALVGFKDSSPTEIGSATCVQIVDRYFLATAAHVISSYPNECLLVVHDGDGFLPIVNRGLRGGGTTDLYDIAWLEVSADVAAQIGKTFIPLSHLHLGLAHHPDHWTLMYGFPDRLIDRAKSSEQELGLVPVTYTTGTVEAIRWPTSCRTDSDIVLEYLDNNNILEDGTPYQLPQPHGMSGGGYWLVTPKTGAVWFPEAHLVGINRSWLPTLRMARGTQIQHWLIMLGEDIPEIKPTIETCIAQMLLPIQESESADST